MQRKLAIEIVYMYKGKETERKKCATMHFSPLRIFIDIAINALNRLALLSI